MGCQHRPKGQISINKKHPINKCFARPQAELDAELVCADNHPTALQTHQDYKGDRKMQH